MPRKSNSSNPLTAGNSKAAPVYLVDAAGEVKYVLVPADQYRRVRPLLEKEPFSVQETYVAQSHVASLAGWDDPAMDAYDEYDPHRPR